MIRIKGLYFKIRSLTNKTSKSYNSTKITLTNTDFYKTFNKSNILGGRSMKKFFKVSMAVAGIAAALSFTTTSFADEEFTPDKVLISVDDAHKLLGKPDVRFVDGDSEKRFLKEHVPGAVNAYAHDLHLLEDVQKCKGLPMCPERAAEFIGKELSIDNNTHVITYDDGKGVNASGVFFFLYLYGMDLDHLDLMDGGLATWKAKGYEIESGPAKKYPPKTFKVKVRWDIIATKEEVLKALKDKEHYVILDSRHNLDEYLGKRLLSALEKPGVHEKVKRGGHIPGAIFSPWTKYAGNKSGKPNKHIFKSIKKLKKQIKKLKKKGLTPDKTVITYCHVGLGRGSFQWLALKLAGLKKVKVYVGSWDEWGNDTSLPIEK